jgi:methionyl aminopeptidase
MGTGQVNQHKLKKNFRIVNGAVLAVEPMIALGSGENQILNDHWTIVTKDGSPSAHFEHTVAITSKGPLVLTCGPNGAMEYEHGQH